MNESQHDSVEEAAELVAVEMVNRLKERPTEMPDHVLGKLFTDLNKLIERRDRGDEGETRPFSLLDELDTLPPARAIELVHNHIGVLHDEFERELGLYEKKLEELENASKEE